MTVAGSGVCIWRIGGRFISLLTGVQLFHYLGLPVPASVTPYTSCGLTTYTCTERNQPALLPLPNRFDRIRLESSHTGGSAMVHSLCTVPIPADCSPSCGGGHRLRRHPQGLSGGGYV